MSLLNGKVNNISFAFKPGILKTSTPLRIIVFYYVRVGNIRLVYYALVDLAPAIRSDNVLWKSVRIKAGEIRPLQNASGDFANFVRYVTEETKVDLFLVKSSPEELSAEEQMTSEPPK